MNDSKAILRQRLRATRKQLSTERVTSFSSAIVQHVVVAPFYQRARTIALYCPTDNEVDPTSLLLDAACSGKAIYLPVVDKSTRSLRFLPYLPGDSLSLGAFGILEPLPNAHHPLISENFRFDLIFQPLVGFDRSGVRLGYGGGYYDRTLSGSGVGAVFASELVGLAYSFQEVPEMPAQPHDVRMGRVVTEFGVCTFVDAIKS